MMKSFKSFRTATIELFSLFVSLCLSFVVCSTYNEDLAALQERLKEEYESHSMGQHPHHLGPPMGIPNRKCDDGRHGIETDWNPLSQKEYTCDSPETIQTTAAPVRIDEPDYNGPVYHICLNKEINYGTPLPLSGNHRPLWPKYGEYIYLPPQRWVHSIEHGAVALLFHPCMRDTKDVEELKHIVRGCLRKHVITPYKQLPNTHPLAIVTYRHGLLLSHFDETDPFQYSEVVDFIQEHAQKAPERRVWKDGQYSVGLLYSAQLVSDKKDSQICPNSFG